MAAAAGVDFQRVAQDDTDQNKGENAPETDASEAPGNRFTSSFSEPT